MDIYRFDEPVEISQEQSLLDYAHSYLVDGFYQPPFNLEHFDKAARANVYCRSGIQVKRNILIATLVYSTKIITLEELTAFVNDYLTTGNGYLIKIRNMLGEVVQLRHLPALYMRVGKNRNRYAYEKNWFEKDTYQGNRIIHLKELDLRQEIYGIPEWFAAISQSLLAEAATLFRRKYYRNGAHAGFLLYINTPKIGEKEEDKIAKELQSMRGLGNFSNIIVNGRGDDKSKLELIPIGQIDAKDDFLNIKNATRDDIMAAHRVPPQLLTVLPANVGGFGDAKIASEVFLINEIKPLQDKIMSINEIIGKEVFTTKDYQLWENMEQK
jgi:PBSX family phage portal protein